MLYTIDRIGLETDGAEWWVAPTAVLIGRVRLEHAASVWWGAGAARRQRADHGRPGSNVQDNCVCHTDPGFPLISAPAVTVGHLALLHGCTLMARALWSASARW